VHKVLQNVIDMANFIKTRSFNSRTFTIPCNKIGSDHENHIPTTRSADYLMTKCLKELSNLKLHYAFFFSTKNCSKLADLFCDDKRLSVVCYLEHI